MKQKFRSFSEFYPFYLSEHANRINRRLHFTGTMLVVLIALAAVFTQHWMWLLAVPFAGYGFAWVGHFFFERNKPATFSHPLYSFVGDWVMFWHILTGKVTL